MQHKYMRKNPTVSAAAAAWARERAAVARTALRRAIKRPPFRPCVCACVYARVYVTQAKVAKQMQCCYNQQLLQEGGEAAAVLRECSVVVGMHPDQVRVPRLRRRRPV